jgi:hypothetical protein
MFRGSLTSAGSCTSSAASSSVKQNLALAFFSPGLALLFHHLRIDVDPADIEMRLAPCEIVVFSIRFFSASPVTPASSYLAASEIEKKRR